MNDTENTVYCILTLTLQYCKLNTNGQVNGVNNSRSSGLSENIAVKVSSERNCKYFTPCSAVTL